MAKKTVEDYIDSKSQWADELVKLRSVLLKSGMDETIKWGAPCYVHNGQNVVGMSAFKDYFGLWFFLGARLDDDAGVLFNAQEGKTQDLRQWRMSSTKDIKVTVIRRYLKAAMALAEAGEKASRVSAKETGSCAELEQAFKKDAKARAAFAALTPGRQREWTAHINDAKREATRLKRLGNALEQIKQGRGLHDRYR